MSKEKDILSMLELACASVWRVSVNNEEQLIIASPKRHSLQHSLCMQIKVFRPEKLGEKL
jgi:hypothetical protein